MKKKQRIWLLTGMVLVGAFLWAGSVFAAEKVSVDRYLRSKRYHSSVYGTLHGQSDLWIFRLWRCSEAAEIPSEKRKEIPFSPCLYAAGERDTLCGCRPGESKRHPLKTDVHQSAAAQSSALWNQISGNAFFPWIFFAHRRNRLCKFCKSMLSVCRDLFRVSPYRQPAVPGNDGSHPEFTGRRSAVLFRKRYVWAYRPCSHVLRRWLYYSCFRALRRDLSFWRNLCETGQLWKPQAGALQADYTGVNEYGRIFTGRRDHQHPRVKR